MAVLRQANLFDGLAYGLPTTRTLEQLVAQARAYVAAVLVDRVCARCCADVAEGELVFHHRRPVRAPWDQPVARLVQVGAARRRLAEEIAKCDVVCRRCLLPHVRHQMLRGAPRRSIGVVAKGRNSQIGRIVA